MKRLNADGNPFRFHLLAREKELLAALLARYPVAPATFQRLIGGETARIQSAQQELEEALAGRKNENLRQLQTLLHTEECLRRDETGYCLTVMVAQMNWLLEVLNEVRVGSWLKLGRPDSLEQLRSARSKTTLRDLYTMEASGYFQMVLLEALNHRVN